MAHGDVVLVRSPPGGPDRDDPSIEPWLGFGGVLLLLAAAGLFARRRSRQKEDEPPRRLLRIFYASAFFAGAMVLMLVLEGITSSRPQPEIVAMTGVAFMAFTFIGLVLFGIADFWIGLFRPLRNRSWLTAAIGLFGLLVFLCFATIYWLAGAVEELLQPEMLQTAGIAASTAIVWWSHLPPPRKEVASLFE